MDSIAEDLRNDGFERTERDSPFHDDGTLWSNSHELVCDKTGIVLSGNHEQSNEVAELSEDEPRYSNSNNVILPGGFASAYDWGDDSSLLYEVA